MKFMKKSLALLFAVVLVFSLSATAFATSTDAATVTDKSTVNIVKNYVSTNGTAPDASFTVEQVGDGKVTDGDATSAPALGTITSVSYTNGATGEQNIVVNLPTYEKVGVYEYTLQEVAGTVAGVTYKAETFVLKVQVTNGANNTLVRTPALYTDGASATKNNTIKNTYEGRDLSISKTVTGAYGDKTKYFTFTVTLTGENGKTYPETFAVSGGSNTSNPTTIALGTDTTFQLKDGDTIKIENLPVGVKYEVTETAVTGYTTTKTGDSGTITTGVDSAAKFTNDKGGSPDTGISLDSLPYVVILVVVLGGAAVLFLRKRHAED